MIVGVIEQLVPEVPAMCGLQSDQLRLSDAHRVALVLYPKVWVDPQSTATIDAHATQLETAMLVRERTHVLIASPVLVVHGHSS